ncbi:MAG: hypothetical protein MHMPM18_003409, partial [Marteilia pararefringens]
KCENVISKLNCRVPFSIYKKMVYIAVKICRLEDSDLRPSHYGYDAITTMLKRLMVKLSNNINQTVVDYCGPWESKSAE